MRPVSYKRTGYGWEELNLLSLFWVLQLFLWGQGPTPSQHLAWLCQSQKTVLVNCFGRTWWSIPLWVSRTCSFAAWTWLLLAPKDTLSLFLCSADPKLWLCSVSGQFPSLLCLYLFLSLAFSEGFLKNGSMVSIDTVHSYRSIDKLMFSAAWLPPLLSVPGLALLGLLRAPPSPGVLSDKMQLSKEMVGIFCRFWFFFFPSWSPIVAVTERIITVGLFCFSLVWGCFFGDV